MKNLRTLMIEKLKEMGADGLCLMFDTSDPEVDCGCGFDDFAPCKSSIDLCYPAKKGKDGLFYPMEDEARKQLIAENLLPEGCEG